MTIPPTWPKAIRNVADLRQLIEALDQEDRVFHFDDDPDEIFNIRTGVKTFTDDEAEHLRGLIEHADILGGVWAMMEDEPGNHCEKLLGIWSDE
jgi:hypothetical protein